MNRLFAGVALAACLVSCPTLYAQETGRVVQVMRDFEGERLGDKRPAVVFWRWTQEQKDRAMDFTSMEIVGGAADGRQCLKLTVTENLPQDTVPPEGYRMVSLNADYLPPEVDAVRMKVKGIKGKLAVGVGGPTVYFGHSDVLSQKQEISPQTHGEWTTIEFDLNENLTRNFRRSEWGAKSPVIYYTRWIQEPIGIVVGKGSVGEILIDQVELVAKGKGRPFPSFSPDQVQTVGEPINLGDEASMENAFTIFTSYAQRTKLDGEPQLVRQAWAPPKLARVNEGQVDALEVVMTGVEEACFAGIKLPGSAEANGIAIRVKAQHPRPSRHGIVLDFALYATPADQRSAFPWEALRPPVSWRNRPDIAYTYYLDARNPALEASSFAMYHTRRTLPPDEWTTVVLPLEDFICFYGQGAMEQAFARQSPLAGENLISLAFLSYYGQRSGPTRVLIDEVRLVKLPGERGELRSYYQVSPK